MKLAKFALTPPIAAISVALFAALSSFGDTHYVATTDVLADVIAGAGENDEIILAKGTHVLGNVTITIDKALDIHGEGESWETILDGEYKTDKRCGQITVSAAGAKISKLTFYRLGAANKTGFVVLSGDSTIEDVAFTGCGTSAYDCFAIVSATAGTISDCYVTNNAVKGNAGFSLSGPVTVENCVFVNNMVTGQGGNVQGIVKFNTNKATLRNCTIANNTLAGQEAVYAGSYSGTEGFIFGKLENCIVWNNTNASTGDVMNYYFRSSTKDWINNCISPVENMPSSNFADDPLLDADGMHITAHSPCKWAADPSCATAFDIAGVARGETPSVGAFEYAGEAVMELDVEIPERNVARLPETIPLVAVVSGSYTDPLTIAWYFNGTNEVADADTAIAALDEPGTYVNPRVVVSDAKGQQLEKAIEGTFCVFPESKASFFVDSMNGDDAAGGTEETPWKTLAQAFAAGSPVQDGDEIVLKAGTHELKANLTVDKAVTIRGAGENWETTLDANHKAYSVLLSADGARIQNLTFYRLGGGDYHTDYVKVTANAVVSNAVFTSCGWEKGASSSILTMSAGLATCCYLTNNACARNAGMTLSGTAQVENCVIVGNTCKSVYGGGVLCINSNNAIVRNCTVANNNLWGQSALTASGWTSDEGFIPGQVYNTIIWNNYDLSTGVPVLKNWYVRGGNLLTYHNNCTSPLKSSDATMRANEGNIDGSPDFKQDGMHLGPNSSCIGAGEVATATEFDITGLVRGVPPCIGAFEYVKTEEMELNLSSSVNPRTKLPEMVQLFCTVTGPVTEPLTFAWSFNGDSETVDSTEQNPFIGVPGTYRNPKVTVRDAAGQVQVKSLDGTFTVHSAEKLVRYVDYANGDNANDGTAANPWKTLASAVGREELFDGDEIILAKGDHIATEPAKITKPLYVHGAGTREETRIMPNGASGRVDNLISISANGATVSDFTIAGFKHSYQQPVVALGGYSTVSNIVVANCGGEEAQGDPVISASRGLVTGCIVTNNIAMSICGMQANGPTVVENCLFANNHSRSTNKDVTKCVIRVYWADGGDGTIRNCTIVNNTMSTNGAAAVNCGWGLTFVNNIVKGNTDTKTGDTIDWRITNDKSSANWKYNCLSNPELLKGAGNFDAEPLFAAEGVQLRVDSPCRNAGDDTLGAQTALDAFGNPRRRSKHIDLGCAECQLGPGLGILVR